MFRFLSTAVVLVSVSALAGCASGARQVRSADSIASQIPGQRVAEAPPEEWEMELKMPARNDGTHHEGPGAHRDRCTPSARRSTPTSEPPRRERRLLLHGA